MPYAFLSLAHWPITGCFGEATDLPISGPTGRATGSGPNTLTPRAAPWSIDVPIPESDISVLIPTYRYRDKAVRAVRSALHSGAGEIIVTDDRGGDGTVEALAAFSDPRLTVLENDRNLGLWENHLHALSFASKPWIKFIQADDFLLPGGLAAYAAAVEPGVTVVWAAPVFVDEASGTRQLLYTAKRPLRLSTRALQDACFFHGWLLGSPSHMMLRADAVERDPRAWRTNISADLVVGSIAAARGDTVLLPPGAIAQGCHPGQDAKTQGSVRGMRRLVASLDYLRRRDEPGLRRLADLWAVLHLWPAARTLASGVVRDPATSPILLWLFGRLAVGPSLTGWSTIARERRLLHRARRYRRTTRPPRDLDWWTRQAAALT